MRAKKRVLIVDDSAAVRQALVEIISSADDLEVMATAGDPFQASEKLRNEVPDVITLDVEMPRMDGVTFLRRLMAQRPIPVVVCSSLVGAGTETLSAVLEAGAVDVIAKPSLGARQKLLENQIQIQDVVRAAAHARLVRRSAAPSRSGYQQRKEVAWSTEYFHDQDDRQGRGNWCIDGRDRGFARSFSNACLLSVRQSSLFSTCLKRSPPPSRNDWMACAK